MFEKTNHFVVLCLCYLNLQPFFKIWDFNTLHLFWQLNEIEKETKKQMLQYELKSGYSIWIYLSLNCTDQSLGLVSGNTRPHNIVKSFERALCDDEL